MTELSAVTSSYTRKKGHRARAVLPIHASALQNLDDLLLGKEFIAGDRPLQPLDSDEWILL